MLTLGGQKRGTVWKTCKSSHFRHKQIRYYGDTSHGHSITHFTPEFTHLAEHFSFQKFPSENPPFRLSIYLCDAIVRHIWLTDNEVYSEHTIFLLFLILYRQSDENITIDFLLTNFDLSFVPHTFLNSPPQPIHHDQQLLNNTLNKQFNQTPSTIRVFQQLFFFFFFAQRGRKKKERQNHLFFFR